MAKYFFEKWAYDIIQDETSLNMKIDLDPEKMPFMKDHFFADTCLIPGAIMAEMMLTACYLLNKQAEIFPLVLNELEIERGIQVETGSKYTASVIAVKINSENNRQYTAEIRGDKLNKSGKVVRKNILIAKSKFSLNAESINMENKITQELSLFEIGQDKFYSFFIRTHHELFQTLLGNLGLTDDKSVVMTSFNIKQKEDNFSVEKALPFLLSPLGFDSILQTSVTFSVISSPGEGEFIYTKLPVKITDFYINKPFEQNCNYTCKVKLINNTEDLLNLYAQLESENGEIKGKIEIVELKKAPFEKYDRGAPARLIEKYKK